MLFVGLCLADEPGVDGRCDIGIVSVDGDDDVREFRLETCRRLSLSR